MQPINKRVLPNQNTEQLSSGPVITISKKKKGLYCIILDLNHDWLIKIEYAKSCLGYHIDKRPKIYTHDYQ